MTADYYLTSSTLTKILDRNLSLPVSDKISAFS